MKIYNQQITLLIALLFSLNTLSAATRTVNLQRGEVVFKAIGKPSFLKVEGKGTQITADLKVNEQELISGIIMFDLSSLSTGIALRDQHMLEDYLKVKNHPLATLTINDVDLSKKGSFKSLLKLNNVEREILVEVKSIKKEEKSSIFLTSFSLELTDFAIDIPSYQGITIAKKVDLNVEVELDHE